jgi:hypothetical protein
MRPAGKARRPSILGIFEEGATPPAGMQRQPNAQLFRGQHTRRLDRLECLIVSQVFHGQDVYARASAGKANTQQ